MFDYLNLWASWSDYEIENIISKESIAILKEVIYLLDDDPETKKINKDNFICLVRKMKGLNKKYSRDLGEAILKAGDYIDNKEISKAKNVYEIFVLTNKSKFYKDIAKSELSRINQNI